MSAYKLKEVIPEFLKEFTATSDPAVREDIVEKFLGQAYDAGYDEGNEQGYEFGREDGFEEGYKEAKSERD